MKRNHLPKMSAMVLVSFLSGCGAPGVREATLPVKQEENGQIQAQRTAAYDGETLFRGILFNEGPVARLLPEIGGGAVPPGEQQAALYQGLMDRIAAREAGFFKEFGVEVQSGDRFRVQRAIERGAMLLTAAYKEHTGVDPLLDELEPMGDRKIVLPVAVAVWLVAAVHTVVWKHVKLWSKTPEMDGNSDLARDRLVEAIATRLTPSP